MAKTKVGGVNGLIDQLLTLMGWGATADVNAQQRKDSLNALNLCEAMISQIDGLLYLRNRSTIALNAGSATASLPTVPGIDVGIDFTIENPSGHGAVSVLAPDKFAATAGAPYDRITEAPNAAMLYVDPADGVMKLLFRRVNATGAQVNYPITYQQIVVALIDNTAGVGSTSLLPEGYELTLLLPCAEEFLKSRKNYPAVEGLTTTLQARVASFYSKYRQNKVEPVTDTNKERRKTEVDVLATAKTG